jgi:tRNA pseudouridine38-40 synthase
LGSKNRFTNIDRLRRARAVAVAPQNEHTLVARAMPRFRLTIEYAGTRYSGWHIQKNARTVQGELHRALAAVFGKTPFETYGSGRTDAGVHALAQVVHVDTAATLPPAPLVARLNDALPADINVLSAERVSPRFHARHSAVARSYLYQIARRRTAFAKPYVWWVREPLDVAKMQAAAASLTGFGDFRAFTDDDPEEKSTRVLIDEVTVAEDEDLILVRVVGSHFLWKMVRRIVGVLVEAGRGGLSPAEVGSLLSGHSDLPPKLTAPASGLFLEKVYYENAGPRLAPGPAVFRVGKRENW